MPSPPTLLSSWSLSSPSHRRQCCHHSQHRHHHHHQHRYHHHHHYGRDVYHQKGAGDPGDVGERLSQEVDEMSVLQQEISQWCRPPQRPGQQQMLPLQTQRVQQAIWHLSRLALREKQIITEADCIDMLPVHKS